MITGRTDVPIVRFVVHVAPHERYEAIEAYGDKLTLAQVDIIKDAPEGCAVALHLSADGCRWVEVFND